MSRNSSNILLEKSKIPCRRILEFRWDIDRNLNDSVNRLETPEFSIFDETRGTIGIYYNESKPKAFLQLTSLPMGTVLKCESSSSLDIVDGKTPKQYATLVNGSNYLLTLPKESKIPSGIFTLIFVFKLIEYPQTLEGDNLAEDYLNLFKSSVLTDCQIRVGEKLIKAHKVVLAARSEVFSAMFEHDLEESRSGEVDLTDQDPKVVEAMLVYMYCGKFTQLDLSAQMLPLTDKYNLPGLKSMCEEALVDQLSVDTASSILNLADRHLSSKLKEYTIIYISNNRQAVLKSEGWNTLVHCNPQLAIQVLNILRKA